MTITETFANDQDFLAAINAARLRKRQQWIFYSGIVGGHVVELKTFGHTYLQRFTINGLCPNLPPMDCKVGEWKRAITQAFSTENK